MYIIHVQKKAKLLQGQIDFTRLSWNYEGHKVILTYIVNNLLKGLWDIFFHYLWYTWNISSVLYKCWKTFSSLSLWKTQQFREIIVLNIFFQVPVLRPMELMVEASPRRIFANAHTYHINSISINSDGETYLSADDLRYVNCLYYSHWMFAIPFFEEFSNKQKKTAF